MRIRVLIRPVMIGKLIFKIRFSIRTDSRLDSISITECPFNLTRFPDKSFIFRFFGYPFTPLGAAGALFGAVVDDGSLLENNTTVFRQRQTSGDIFCKRGEGSGFKLALVFP